MNDDIQKFSCFAVSDLSLFLTSDKACATSHIAKNFDGAVFLYKNYISKTRALSEYMSAVWWRSFQRQFSIVRARPSHLWSARPEFHAQ